VSDIEKGDITGVVKARKCEACGHRLETLQKISDSPLTDCPECGKPALRKMVSAAAFRLKGSGWYETDFKTGNKKNVAKSDKKEKSAAKPEKKGKAGSTAAKKKSAGNTQGTSD